MKKILLFTCLLLCAGMNFSYGQFAQNATGFYSDASVQYDPSYAWGSYIGAPPAAYGSLSQSTNGSEMITVCTNIMQGTNGILVSDISLTNPIDLSLAANRVIHVKMKSTVAVQLSIQLEDGNGTGYKLNWGSLPIINLPGDNTYHIYTIDFSATPLIAAANMSSVGEIDFEYFGSTAISPTISIDNIDAGNGPVQPLPPCLTTTTTSFSESACTLTDYPNYYWTDYVASDGGGTINMTQGANGTILFSCSNLYAGATESASIATFDMTNNPVTPSVDLSAPCSQNYFIRLKSTSAISLSLQLRDGATPTPNYKLTWDAITLTIPGDNTFHDYNVPFSSGIAAGANMTNVGNAFLVYSNKVTHFTGVITVDSMSVGGPATTSSEPTTGASNLTVSNITPTAMTLNWTNGNGSNRMVEVSSSSINGPHDGITVTGNSVYGSGTDLYTPVPGHDFAVYSGSGSSVTVTGLNSTSYYTINVFEYNNNGCGPNYETVNYPSAFREPLASEPTTGSSNITFTSLALTNMTVNWTAGNGSRRMVIAKLGSTVNQLPSDYNTTYVANSTFGAGTDLGGGNFVIYDGTGTSVNLLGLTASTNYYFAVIEYNDYAGDGNMQAYNYKTSTYPSANQATLTPEPTSAATSILFSNVANTSMDLSWTNGNGARRLVLAHASSAVGQLPIDYTAYTASASFGSGTDLGGNNYVVYDGTGSTFSLSNLTSGITYYFSVFEYNGLGVTANYYTSIFPTGNQATTSGAVTEPTTAAINISFATVGSSSFTINWTNGNGANRLVLVKQGSAVSASPADNVAYTASAAFGAGTQVGTGNYVVYSGSASTVALTGLNPSTTYYVSVFEYNGSGVTANFLTTGAPTANQATTAGGTAEPTSPATSLSFTSVLSTSFTINWTNGNGASRIVVLKQGSAVDTDPSDNTPYTANAAYGSGSQLGSGNYVIYSGTGTSVAVTGLVSATTYYVEVYEFNGSGGTANYLTSSTLTGNQSTIVPEPTTAATSITFATVAATSFTINWTSGNGASRLVLVKQGSAVNASPSDNVAYTASNSFGTGTQVGTGNYAVYSGSGSSVALTGLIPSTTYYVSVFEYNGSGAAANFLTTGAPTANQATISSGILEPTTAASNITFSGINTFSMTVSWTNGNGTGRVLVVHQGSPVTNAPADFNGYATTANSNLALAPSLGGGNFVVYSGSLSSVTVTGLTSGTDYYYSLYEYNGSGGTSDYLTSTFATNNESTTSVTATTDAKEADKIKLYPNPNTGNVEIDLSDILNITQIQIVNDLGLLVNTIDLDNASGIVNVNTSNLSSGIYYLMIKKSDNSQLTKKMIRY